MASRLEPRVIEARKPTDLDLTLRIAASDETLFLFGGTHLVRSADGKVFAAKDELDIGIKGVLATGKEVWVCGGGLLRSTDGGQTFKQVKLPSSRWGILDVRLPRGAVTIEHAARQGHGPTLV